MEEKIDHIKVCKVSGNTFDVMNRDLQYYHTLSPTFDGQTFFLSPPTLSPSSRQQRRLAHRNLNTLYKRNCDLT